MTKTEMQSVYDSVFAALESAGMNPREGGGADMTADVGGLKVKITVAEAGE